MGILCEQCTKQGFCEFQTARNGLSRNVSGVLDALDAQESIARLNIRAQLRRCPYVVRSNSSLPGIH